MHAQKIVADFLRDASCFSFLGAMLLRLLFAFSFILLSLPDHLSGETLIQDPIADYLAMKVPDRNENAGRLLIVKRVEVDVANDGQKEVFIGTWYRKSGPDTWLWVGYRPVAGGYERMTPSNSDVLIDFDKIYVGPLPEIQKQGMAQAYSLELTNQDRDQSNMISDLSFYYIEDGKLIQKGTGPLDLDDPDQKAKYDFYFGPNCQINDTPRIESFTVYELAQRGYKP
jgi:hypothetical protein